MKKMFKNNKEAFKDFENLSSENSSFNKIIPIKRSSKFKLSTTVNDVDWLDIFYNETNNLKNLNYNNKNDLIFESKK